MDTHDRVDAGQDADTVVAERSKLVVRDID